MRFSRERLFGAVAVLCSVAFYVLSMPGADVASLAWVWAVPMALWAATRPRWKNWLIGSAICAWLGGALTLIWLRNLYPPLGWLAVVLLPLAYSAFPFFWLIALRLIFPASGRGRAFPSRLLNLLGLAGFWILLEWALTWVLSGFPWMPLGATQWQRPAMLAFCPWTGTAGASFLIIFFNLGVARYIRHLTVEIRERESVPAAESSSTFLSFRSFCPEFYCALVPVLLSVVVYWFACLDFAKNNEKYFSFAAVQTNFDPQEKWDEPRIPASIAVLEALTDEASANVPAPDFILFPEAALPIPVNARGFPEWISSLAARAGKPIVFGGIRYGDEGNGYYNAVQIAYPQTGLAKEFFAKRHLVPFGEYLPFASVLPFRKIVPVAADCLAGTSAEPLALALPERTFSMGVLVCYEDVFPELGRELVANGADFLAVVTNDAWYGEEAGAYQHAAHSVMQAVSLGVPVVRCGNAGWSGVIDPLGHATAMTADGNDDGSIYFRGQRRFDVFGWRRSDSESRFFVRDAGEAENSAAARKTFYARHGDLFTSVGGLLFLGAYLRNRRRKRKKSA